MIIIVASPKIETAIVCAFLWKDVNSEHSSVLVFIELRGIGRIEFTVFFKQASGGFYSANQLAASLKVLAQLGIMTGIHANEMATLH